VSDFAETCPRCAGGDIQGAKFGLGDVQLYEFRCRRCRLFEFRRTSDTDFDAWLSRWQADEDNSEDDKEATLAQIVAKPWDDTPRLAYADAVQSTRPERAELIRLQIERFASERARGIEVGRPSAREKQLLERHGDDWARYIAHYARPFSPSAEYQGYEFERGFVAQIRTDPDIVSDATSRLFELAPIEHLDLTNDGDLRSALLSPALAALRSLRLNDVGLTDEDVVAFARDGHVDRLEWLDLRANKFGRAGVEALVASPKIRSIPMVLLGSHPYNPGVQFELADNGAVADWWFPEYGQMLEKQFGRVDWLHLPYFMKQPDRYHARSVKLVD